MKTNIEDPIESLQVAIAFSSRDWAIDLRDAWIYGILIGWDEPALSELVDQFGWDENTVARLERLRQRFDELYTPNLEDAYPTV